jgi:hypothetical protein
MKNALMLSLLILTVIVAAAKVQGETTNVRMLVPEQLRVWVDARAGTGETVHWVANGGIYAYPSGEKLFGMVGFDSSTVIWPETVDGEVIHLTRKTFAFTDPDSGTILTEYEGKPVAPIAYPYQMITYRIEDGRIFGDVEQGVGDRIQKIESVDGMRVGMIGDNTMTVTASVFLDFPLPNGTQYEAWENYDFFIHTGINIDEPHQMSWQRYGALPGWAGDGKAIYHLLSWRAESLEEFPEDLLRWARENKPMWLKPPASVEEVRELQQGSTSERWAQ